MPLPQTNSKKMPESKNKIFESSDDEEVTSKSPDQTYKIYYLNRVKGRVDAILIMLDYYCKSYNLIPMERNPNDKDISPIFQSGSLILNHSNSILRHINRLCAPSPVSLTGLLSTNEILSLIDNVLDLTENLRLSYVAHLYSPADLDVFTAKLNGYLRVFEEFLTQYGDYFGHSAFSVADASLYSLLTIVQKKLYPNGIAALNVHFRLKTWYSNVTGIVTKLDYNFVCSNFVLDECDMYI